jgi:hypothetical protein
VKALVQEKVAPVKGDLAKAVRAPNVRPVRRPHRPRHPLPGLKHRLRVRQPRRRHVPKLLRPALSALNRRLRDRSVPLRHRRRALKPVPSPRLPAPLRLRKRRPDRRLPRRRRH